MRACNSCQFWEQYRDESGTTPAWGFCLRYPPVPVARSESETRGGGGIYRECVSASVSPEWPEVRANEWCGEFRKADA